MANPKPSDAKTLMVLGLLQAGPRHGYELHRIVVAHGALYADFKKPTLYHLLHRLTVQGAVVVHAEGGTRGRRGERLVFALTPAGGNKFQDLLRNALSTYDPAQTTFEMAAAYLPWIPVKEAEALLAQRRDAIKTRHAEVVSELNHLTGEPASQRLAARSLATDHALSLLDAELAWMERAARHLASPGGRTTLLERAGPALRRQPVTGNMSSMSLQRSEPS
jgi:DNA-binding PadR family transcriptional regulator